MKIPIKSRNWSTTCWARRGYASSNLHQTEVAKSQGIITYSEIAPLAGLDMANPDDRNKMGELLGEISTFEHNQKPPRPLLSVVVIHRDNNIIGKGFFTLARELGFQSVTTNDQLFFIGELRKVHDYWRTT